MYFVHKTLRPRFESGQSHFSYCILPKPLLRNTSFCSRRGDEVDNVLRRLPNKKGVQIPVMMIVILIIAIITLGLIIGFIQFFFTDIDQTVREQLAGVKADLRSNLKEGRSLVDTSFGEKLEVKLGEAKPVAFAIKNTGSNPDGETVCYRAGIQCLKSHDLDGRCTPTQPSNVFVQKISGLLVFMRLEILMFQTLMFL
jgi:type II secretory pathway pseudopilin PulG